MGEIVERKRYGRAYEGKHLQAASGRDDGDISRLKKLPTCPGPTVEMSTLFSFGQERQSLPSFPHPNGAIERAPHRPLRSRVASIVPDDHHARPFLIRPVHARGRLVTYAAALVLVRVGTGNIRIESSCIDSLTGS